MKRSSKAEVTVDQAKAIEMLGKGHKAMECAKAAGVSRMTLYRWMHKDANFIAAWNAWRRMQVKVARSRLLGLTNTAIDAVETSLTAGDGKLAVKVLERMGILEQEPAGPEEPEAVRRELESDVREQRGKVVQREQATVMDALDYEAGSREEREGARG